ncbi:17768_t:CDS:1, partial [Cetraspora pellucida]
MSELQELLCNYHIFYPLYLQAYKILLQAYQNNTSNSDLKVYLHFNILTDKHQYNILTSNEIAIILPRNGSLSKLAYNIILHLRE